MIEDDDILRAAAVPQRLVLLEEAMRLTGVERRAVYGDPVLNHAHIARIFNAWTGRDLTAAEIVKVHMATKMARMATTPDHRDSHVDLMAYAGILYECVLAEAGEAGDDRSA
jgi:hypothetical protein